MNENKERLPTLLCIVLRTKIHKKVDNLLIFKKFFFNFFLCVEFVEFVEGHFLDVELDNALEFLGELAVDGALYK